MPSCLRDLFEQTSCEQDKRFANNLRSSTESCKSVLEVSGMKLPPLLVRKRNAKSEIPVLSFEETKISTRA